MTYQKRDTPLKTENFHWEDQPREKGKTNFFLLVGNHLGNVLEVLTDRKLAQDNGVYDPETGLYSSATEDGIVDYYIADVVSQSDYYPFGATLSNTNIDPSTGLTIEESDDYRYSFQGQEKDDEIKGENNSLNYTFRMHDPRVGRFFAVDPLTSQYPHNSPYAFSENNLISCVELEGLEIFYAADGSVVGTINGSTEVRLVSDDNIAATMLAINNANEAWARYEQLDLKAHTPEGSSPMEKEVAYLMVQLYSNYGSEALSLSTSTGMDQDELNARAFLGMIKQTEAGRANPPLEYNSWNGTGQTFTDCSYDECPDDYAEHPGANSNHNNGTAAGAYQFLERFYPGDDFSPQSQDAAVIGVLVRYNSSQNALDLVVSGDMSAVKSSTWFSARWDSFNYFSAEQMQTLFNEMIIDELNGESSVGTEPGELLPPEN